MREHRHPMRWALVGLLAGATTLTACRTTREVGPDGRSAAGERGETRSGEEGTGGAGRECPPSQEPGTGGSGTEPGADEGTRTTPPDDSANSRMPFPDASR